jgi:lipoprotein-anchoring transpeptidase ErfK/SrfK
MVMLQITRSVRIFASLLMVVAFGLNLSVPSFAALPNGSTPTMPGGGVGYTYEKGDSLNTIAERFGVTVKDIMRANGIRNSRRITSGMVLTIPTTPNAISPWIAREIDPKPTDGKVIYVSLSKQRMSAYDGDQLIFDFLVSTGLATEENPYRDTKPGVFRIKTKMSEAFANLWQLRMPYWMGIYDAGEVENGIHAMPYRKNGRPVSWRVGSPGSFGCIVLNGPDAIKLYRWANLGTLVVIRL